MDLQSLGYLLIGLCGLSLLYYLAEINHDCGRICPRFLVPGWQGWPFEGAVCEMVLRSLWSWVSSFRLLTGYS